MVLEGIAYIIAGIVSIAFVSTWPRGTAKSMLLVFIAMFLIVSPVVGLVLIGIANSTGLWSIGWYFGLLCWFNVLSLIPFLVFAGNAKQYFLKNAKSRTPTESGMGPVWSTNLNKAEIKRLSTKRNLAFVVDLLPGMALSIGSFYLQWMLVSGSLPRSLGALLSVVLFVFAIASIAYLLLKDSLDGQSIGKRMFGCRVVSSETGRPAGLAASLTRNWIFLLPFMALVELIVSKTRADGKRLGDLWAQTQFVAGPPQWVDGILIAQEVLQKKHALDD